MGYMSSGACRIKGPKDVMLDEYAKFLFSLTPEQRKHIDENVVVNVLDSDSPYAAVLIGFEVSGKWYKQYRDVEVLEALHNHFDGVPGVDGAFVRYGENNDDVETSYYGDDPYELVEFVRTHEAVALDDSEMARDHLRSALESRQTQQGDPANGD